MILIYIGDIKPDQFHKISITLGHGGGGIGEDDGGSRYNESIAVTWWYILLQINFVKMILLHR